MSNILGITHDLSQALQKKDHNIANAVKLVQITRQLLELITNKIFAFCMKHNIYIPNVDDKWVLSGRARCNAEERPCEFYYRVKIFYTVVDQHLEELRHCFSETNTKILTCSLA